MVGKMIYHHKQTGKLLIWITGILVLYFIWLFTITEYDYIILVVMVFIIIAVSSFASLRVMIDNKYLKIKFGYGIFKKGFELKEITSAKKVQNHWYYGYGIRYWSNMWIYNVSGFDAVEIKMKNGKRYRIGTDEPEKLERALLQSIKR